MQMSWSVLINDYTQACHFTITVQTLGRSTTWEVMPRIRWATIKPLGSKEVVVTITLLIDELFIYLCIYKFVSMLSTINVTKYVLCEEL